MCGGYKKGENPSAFGKNKIQWITDLPAGLRGRVIFGKGNNMTNEKAIMCLEDMKIKVPIPKAAKQARENNEALDVAIKALAESEHGTNLASLGTDCISREQAIDAIEAEKIKHGNYLTSSYVGYEMAEKVVKQLPPIQPKRGKWIEDKGQQTLMQNFIEKGEVWRVCSVCGAGHMIGHKYECDKAYHETYHNFCPNCGAKMEE